MLSLADVTRIAAWVRAHLDATVADVMAEFDITYDQFKLVVDIMHAVNSIAGGRGDVQDV